MLLDPQHGMTAALTDATSLPHGPSGIWRRVQQALCSLHGHDSLLQFEQNRMFLRCTSCGYETPGWEIEHAGAELAYAGERHVETLTPAPEMFATRKIA